MSSSSTGISSPYKSWVKGEIVGLRPIGACVTYQSKRRKKTNLNVKARKLRLTHLRLAWGTLSNTIVGIWNNWLSSVNVTFTCSISATQFQLLFMVLALPAIMEDSAQRVGFLQIFHQTSSFWCW